LSDASPTSPEQSQTMYVVKINPLHLIMHRTIRLTGYIGLSGNSLSD